MMVQEETVLYYAKGKAVKECLLLLPFSLFGGWLIGYSKDPAVWAFGIFLILLCGGLMWLDLRKLFIHTPRLIISSEGIKIAGRPLISWEYISDEKVVTKYLSRGGKCVYLEFLDGEVQQKVRVDELTLSSSGISHALMMHRIADNARRAPS